MNTKKSRHPYHHRRGITPFRRKLLCLIALFFFSSNLAFANPNGPQVVNGNVGFRTQGNTLTVTNSPNSIINWQGFSIGINELTRFIQQSGNSAVLNRVIGQDPSAILGALQSNGRVFLINPNGILFGQGARIDVNGLIASTLNLSNQDFLAGKYNFTAGIKAGSIENQGTITTPMGGQVYLIAPDIKNSGIINSPKGDVILAAGHSVQLVDSANPYIAVTVSAPENSVVNLGKIIADSGRIGIYGGLISQKGIVKADSAVAGENGRILFKATKGITLEKDSITTANGPQGGKITIRSETDTTIVSGAVTATGSEGKGGEIQVLGRQVGLTGNALVDVSGKSGGGTVLVGGDYQGRNPEIQNALATYIGANATIKANATETGDGGKVIVWSDGDTSIAGNISARGGLFSGNGGFVETSGHKLSIGDTARVNTIAPKGLTGNWLLDPLDFTIGITTGDITGSTLSSNLEGTDVIIQTDNVSTGGNGDIFVQNDVLVSWSAATNLTLEAFRNINIGTNAIITKSEGSAGSNVTLNANRGEAGGAIYMDYGSSITSNGGNITLGGGNDPSLTPAVGTVDFPNGVYISGATLDASGGKISIIGKGYDNDSGGPGGHGVSISGATLTTTSGKISITGTGGAGGGNEVGYGYGGYGGYGVYADNSTITTENGGNISIKGTGGLGGAASGNYGYGGDGGHGVYAYNSTIKTVGSGNITIDGTGGAGGAASGMEGTGGDGGYGMVIEGSTVQTNGTAGTDSITITGTGGAGGSNEYGYGGYGGDGVNVMSDSWIQTSGGAISITGYGGDGGDGISGVDGGSNEVGNGGRGVYADTSTITTGGGGNISIVGTGGKGGDATYVEAQASGGGYGVYAYNSTITTENDGNISIEGTGGAGGAASGVGGTGGYGGYGVYVGGSVTSAGGTIDITGTGGSGDTGGYGIYTYYASLDSGAGAMTLTGRGADGAEGLYFNSNTIIGGPEQPGPITLIADSSGPSSIAIVDNDGGGYFPIIQGAGTLNLQPFNPASTIGLAGGLGEFNLGTEALNAITGFSNVVIGRTDGTGFIDVGPTGWIVPSTANLTLQNPGLNSEGMHLGGPLELDAGKNLTLNTTGLVTQDTELSSITAGGLELLGAGGYFLLTSSSNSVGTLAGGTADAKIGGVAFNNGYNPLTINSVNSTITGLNASDFVAISSGTLTQTKPITADVMSNLNGTLSDSCIGGTLNCWTGGGSEGNWSDTANWSLDHVPGSTGHESDTVRIVTADSTPPSIFVSAASVASIVSTADLTISDLFTINNGDSRFLRSLTTTAGEPGSGTLDIAPNATANISKLNLFVGGVMGSGSLNVTRDYSASGGTLGSTFSNLSLTKMGGEFAIDAPLTASNNLRLNAINGTLTINQPLTATNNVTLKAGYDVNGSTGLTTQTESGYITATGLELLSGSASYVLTNSSNSITTLAGNVASVNFSQSGDIKIGTVNNTTGITAGGDVTLTAGCGECSGSITFDHGAATGINTPTGTVRLYADDAVVNAAGTTGTNIVANSLVISASSGIGSTKPLTTQVNRLNAMNTIIASTVSGDIQIDNGGKELTIENFDGLTNSEGYSIGISNEASLGKVVLTNNRTILLNGNYDTGIYADGDISLTTTGATSDIRTGGGNTAIESLSGSVTLTADKMDLQGSVNGSTVTLQPYTTTTQIAVGSGAVDATGILGLDQSELDNITASSLIIGRANGTGKITVVEGGLDVYSDLTLQNTSGGMAIDGPLTTVSNLTLNTTGTVTQGAGVTATGLELLGTGAYTLNGSNSIGTLAGNIGSLDFVNSGDLTIGTVNTKTGLTSEGNITLTSAGKLTIDSAISSNATGSGAPIKLIADKMDINNNADIQAGNSSVTITPFSAATEGGTDRDIVVISGSKLYSDRLELLDAELNRIKGNTLILGGLGVTDYTAEVVLEAPLTLDSAKIGNLKLIGTNIVFESGSTITTNGTGPVNVTLNADKNSNGGAIRMYNSSGITSNGGTITLGGGADPLTTPAVGTGGYYDGVYLDGAQINAGGGNISIMGKGLGGGYGGYGVNIGYGSQVKSTGGTIKLDGETTVSGSNDIYMESSLVSTSGNITLTGHGNELWLYQSEGASTISTTGSGTITGSGFSRLRVERGDITSENGNINLTAGAMSYSLDGRVQSTGSGQISLTATGPDGISLGGSDYADNKGYLGSDTASGNISLTTDKLTVWNPATVQGDLYPWRFKTGGALIIKPYSPGMPIDLGADTVNLSLTSETLKTMTAGILKIGDSSAGDITIASPIGSIPPTPGSTLSLQTGGGIYGSGNTITVSNLALSGGTGAINVTTAAGTVAAQNTSGGITISNTKSTGLTVGSVDGLSGLSSNNGAISLTETMGDVTIANTVNAGTGNVTLKATGALVNGITSSDKNVIANSLDATAGNGIGDQKAMKTEVANLTAENTGGSRNIEFNNQGALTITDGILNSGSGNIVLDNTGAIDTGSQKIQAPQGAVTVTAHSPLTIGSGGLTADGDVTLEAAQSGGNDTLTINGPVRSNNGNVSLAAGSSIIENVAVEAPNGHVTRTVHGALMGTSGSLTTQMDQAVVQSENTFTTALNNTYISTVEGDNARTAPPPEKKEDEDKDSDKKGSTSQSEETSKAKLPYCN